MCRSRAGFPIVTGTAIAIVWSFAPQFVFAQSPPPLDILDGTLRNVLVQLEGSADPSIVGQDFGAEFPATYSASENIGTLVISAATHELMLAGGYPPVPGSFTPITIQFDLTTFEATSQPASGAMGSGQIGGAFTQQALDTLTVGGFAGPDLPPLFCTSQAQLDDACLIVPLFCGQVCTIVPGAPYDPATGLMNLVGVLTESGCDGSLCSGPFDYFATRGDLMLTEAPPVVEDGDGDNGGPCFIATAAYGTPLAAELEGLREFRDARLLANPFGVAFSDAYYRISPPIADRLARDHVLRSLVKCALAPILRIVRR